MMPFAAVLQLISSTDGLFTPLIRDSGGEGGNFFFQLSMFSPKAAVNFPSWDWHSAANTVATGFAPRRLTHHHLLFLVSKLELCPTSLW